MKRLLLLLICGLFFFAAVAQKINVSGTVSGSEDGMPLPGANVHIKGTTIGTATDMDGKFSINVSDSAATLIVTFIGYKQQELNVAGRNIINIILESETVRLDEVVVTSLGIFRSEESIAYSASSSSYSSAATKIISKSPDNIAAGILTAGEVNDFSKWVLWNDKSQDELNQYRKDWIVYPSIRFSVLVQNEDGIPVIDEEVVLLDKNKNRVWITKTDNGGKAELWANMFDDKYDNNEIFSISASYDGRKYRIQKAKRFNEGINQLTIERTCSVPDIVDAVFVVDATGSMGDEINYLKEELNDVIQKVKDNNGDILLRLGSVFYRDRGDDYVTRNSDLSDDISKTINFIKEQYSDGGGDTPEAVEEALDVAINQLTWSKNARTKIIFLVLDAPPHQTPEILEKMQSLIKRAASLGIKIVPIAGSGIDKSTEYLMRAMALCSNGTYLFLTDHSGVGDSHIDPTTDSYEVEKFNDLLVRIFKQYTSVVTCNKEILISTEKEISDTTIFVGVVKSEEDSVQAISNEDKILIKKDFSCKFYPNPTSGILNIEIEGRINEIFMTDISGKILERYLVNGKNYIQIDISPYPRGVYFMTYYGDNNRPSCGKIVLNQ